MIPSWEIHAENDSKVGSALPMLPEQIRMLMSCSEGEASMMMNDEVGCMSTYVNAGG